MAGMNDVGRNEGWRVDALLFRLADGISDEWAD